MAATMKIATFAIASLSLMVFGNPPKEYHRIHLERMPVAMNVGGIYNLQKSFSLLKMPLSLVQGNSLVSQAKESVPKRDLLTVQGDTTVQGDSKNKQYLEGCRALELWKKKHAGTPADGSSRKDDNCSPLNDSPGSRDKKVEEEKLRKEMEKLMEKARECKESCEKKKIRKIEELHMPEKNIKMDKNKKVEKKKKRRKQRHEEEANK